jgi:adenylosuccinate synthase
MRNHFSPQLANLDILSEVEVEYVTLPGWQVSIQNVRKFEELPANCKAYVKFVEDYLGVPVEWIGTGPGRDNMIHRK